MGTWRVDAIQRPGIVWLELDGSFNVEEMRAFANAHDQAIENLGGRDYKVFCDIRGMQPLAPECAELFERCKRFSASRSNFRGSAVHVASAIVAMQYRRTSVASGVADTELQSEEEGALWAHLGKVYRRM